MISFYLIRPPSLLPLTSELIQSILFHLLRPISELVAMHNNTVSTVKQMNTIPKPKNSFASTVKIAYNEFQGTGRKICYIRLLVLSGLSVITKCSQQPIIANIFAIIGCYEHFVIYLRDINLQNIFDPIVQNSIIQGFLLLYREEKRKKQQKPPVYSNFS